MTTYEQLRKIIIASNHSLLELSFGCEVEGGKISRKVYSPDWKCECMEIIDGKNSQILPVGEIKIIGHPITLADVLIALEKQNSQAGYETERGFIECVDYQWSLIGKEEIFWNLKNTLTEQSEETQKWLLEVLK